MNDPGRPNASPKPPLENDGAVATGSGKFARPCRRMHCDSLSMFSFCASVAWPGPAPPGPYLAQSFRAVWKAGDWGLIPEPIGILIPPPPPGSGKLGTPCDRMQFANARPDTWFADAVPDLLDPPQATSAKVQPAMSISAGSKRIPRSCGPAMTRRNGVT